jgi:polyketide cyclase/dehydrase/lipid transport protein
MSNAYFSTVLDSPLDRVWEMIRDFNRYPDYIDGVDDSYIEEELSGTAVGGVRNFGMGETRLRQRLVALSDVNHYFTYEGVERFEVAVDGATRTVEQYRGTMQLHPITNAGRCFLEWTVEYLCPPEDSEYWTHWWDEALGQWSASLRDHLPAAQ